MDCIYINDTHVAMCDFLKSLTINNSRRVVITFFLNRDLLHVGKSILYGII